MPPGDQPLEVGDTRRPGRIAPHLFLAGLIATPLLLARHDPPILAFIEAQPRGTLQGFIFLMPTLNAAMAFDLIGRVREPHFPQTRTAPDRVRVEGLYGWRRHRFYREEAGHISVRLNHVPFVRRTDNPVIGVLQSFRGRGDSWRGGAQIYLRPSSADGDLRQILFELERYCPGLLVISSPRVEAFTKDTAGRVGA